MTDIFFNSFYFVLVQFSGNRRAGGEPAQLLTATAGSAEVFRQAVSK